MKQWGFITIIISTLLWWGWLSAPIVGVASTTDSPATIRFNGKTESSTQGTDDDQLNVTENSKSSHSVPTKSSNSQAVHHRRPGWLPQTSEQWWLRAFIGGIGLLVLLIIWQLITYLKKRRSLS
ncbi:cell surface protein [Lactiplantibacillus mudanjiangensis]|uniref:Cell surface protein [Lactobacillus plantarum] n=1 Tax=Lactiplantibacillus mudanjiangensis TaxID=1296538 RepID=A0A660DZ70_9LACO|nr:cell surface protein [Lactiplantibacillus mudanjiangensis]VDG18606.1 cell surface protein [Lactobacillus plantarum] [Lactiplantibacillus mudanjiangensis]VDG25883.1 cell surface protein [Lactobacillus plantarum] [Lactiplantibacillus mudanjiangensis]VDG28685.1 cell surface protein [Lactobacillus plantarum] [Lactiplantibacillus mudanjiangensis]VDG33716.1 cell surface protein [Lactobacillus plantarum] [Lactiplantibacillus mudanjiangensis]